MTAALWKSATTNAFSTTLNGSINSSDATITLTTVTGLQFPGVLVIDRADSSGTSTPSNREYITYTGITGSQLTGCSRGVAGSSAQAHTSGALVEETFSVTHWGDLNDFLAVSHDSAGRIVAGTATITTARVITHLNASGASISGNFPIHPGWFVAGTLANASLAGKPVPLPQNGAWRFWTAVVNTPVSAASLVLDVKKNGVSIFDTATRPFILGGGTFVSTASIATITYNSGDILTMDIVNAGGADLTILGKGV